eukprot:CAMPEP_0168731558 /NCGR_PEP_ID=MMETSP0724-20121128/7323_1 /TAXON_ID=265536 /ORGANISM="Amphiprora sp., Strain CCMP467" /LENGTH=775 /DNA_ID=CAMNT_0008778561 /DNA_START=76 /DNA_END=2403 /DNA_ORIENTATION=-
MVVETSWDVAARWQNNGDSPPPPQRRRRRVQSDEDLRLAVPVRAELWNLFVPSNDDDEEEEEEEEDHDDENDTEEPHRSLQDQQQQQQQQQLQVLQSQSSDVSSSTRAPKKRQLWYQGSPHESSILTRVELQVVVYDEPQEDDEEEEEEEEEEEILQQYETPKNNDGQHNTQDEANDNDSTTANVNFSRSDPAAAAAAAAIVPEQQPCQKEIVLFQGQNDNGYTIHPCWYHLQEQLDGNNEWINLHRDTYETLEFRFFSVKNQKDKNDCTEATTTTTTTPFLACPVHPSQLVALGGCTEDLPSTEFLPINTLAVYFSDHSLRILPQHYELLVEHQPNLFDRLSYENSGRPFQSSLVQSSSSSFSHPNKNNNSNKNGGRPHSQQQQQQQDRFGDSAFRALDAVAVSNNPQEDEHEVSIMSTEPEEELEESNSRRCDDDDDDPTNGEDDIFPTRSSVLQEDLLQEQAHLLQLIEQEKHALQCQQKELQQVHDTIANQLIPQCQEIDQQTAQVHHAISQEQAENQKLNYLLEAHRIRLVRGLQDCFPIDLQGRKNQKSVQSLVTTSMASSLLLGSTYGGGSPANAGTYILNHNGEEVPCPTLRGWSLPVISSSNNNSSSSFSSNNRNSNNNNNSTGNSRLVFSAVSDEELSAVLGSLGHVVTLLAKYLDVSLPYRIFCNSSRSAVQDDRGVIFPLFLARPVEREQVEHALHLIERNVICIAKARGISTTTVVEEGGRPQQQQQQQRNLGVDKENKLSVNPLHVLELLQSIYKAMTVPP